MRLGKRVMMGANAIVRRSVFCRRGFARLAFGVDVAGGAAVHSYCEWCTVAMRLVLPKYLRAGMRVLDMGTGAHAMLAVYVKRLCGDATVLATDIMPQRIDLARQTAQRNGVEVRFHVGDLFDRLEGRFDLVLFCPPLTPSGDLEELGYPMQEVRGLGVRRCWSSDGGADGLQIIGPFLRELRPRLAPGGRALVAINPSNCPDRVVQRLCEESNLGVWRVHRFFGIVRTYVIGALGESGVSAGETP